ncbi:MAG: thioredoxin family protein [Bacteroidia bacterium]
MKKSILTVLSIVFILGFSPTSSFESFENSLEQAKKSNKNLLLIFSGSDWCKPCILLKKNILDTEEFSTFSDSNFIQLHLDFPYKKANQLEKEEKLRNEKLAERYNSEGVFPKIVIIDYQQNILGEVHYSKSMDTNQLINQLKSFTK